MFRVLHGVAKKLALRAAMGVALRCRNRATELSKKWAKTGRSSPSSQSARLRDSRVTSMDDKERWIHTTMMNAQL